jgi:hypothetical protein
MRRLLLKAWMIGWAITLISSALMAVVHTPLALVGTVLLLPGMLSMPLAFEIGRMLGLSDETMGIVSLISTAMFASLFYGAVVFVVLRLRRAKVKSTPEPDTPSV